MKPHLSVVLFPALLCSYLAQAVEIPSDYKSVTLRRPSDISDYYGSSSTSSNYAFILKYDLACTPTSTTSWTSSTPAFRGKNLLFTTADGYSLRSLSFSNGEYSPLRNSNVTFDTLRHLSFTGMSGTSAFYGYNYDFCIRNVNDRVDGTADVVFSNNQGNNEGAGALDSVFADIEISNCGDVIFSNNCTTEYDRNYGEAGAIKSLSGKLIISGNDNVTFEKNYVKNDNGYCLRSICKRLSTLEPLQLCAKTGGTITFYDSVYAYDTYNQSETILNKGYTDENGVYQYSEGDIIFSGKYTEEHLIEVKGSVGTATEIANSRTSDLQSTVNLYGGTLRVEDKAVLKTHALNVTEGSNATLRISDGEVNAGTYNVSVYGTGTLELTGAEGSGKLTAKNLYIEKDGTLSVVDVVDPSEVITLADAATVSIFNEKLGGIVSGNVYMEVGSTYRADGAHLSVQNGILTFNPMEDEKINLVLSLMAAYNDDSQVILFTDVNTVDFVLDNITATKSGESVTLKAADYFTGDWINDNTSLVYDKGTIYVTGVNRIIPEPTTATLSLLALAALAARRRRNK